MYFELSEDFTSRLYAKYDEAVANEHLKYNGDSCVNEVVAYDLDGFQFDGQYTLLKSLIHRPEKGDVNKNPFAEPEPELTVCKDFGDKNQFRIVFNKFPVVPRHIMILTKAFKPQASPLSPDELIATYTVLKRLKETEKEEWFAFYNSGLESGASQPHKHIQLMTLPGNFRAYSEVIAEQSEAFVPTTKREPLQSDKLPMAHFVAKLPAASTLDEETLVMSFSALLQRTMTVLRENNADHISYNVIMTTKYIMLVPRSHGKYEDIGINSCGILGLILCKDEKLLQQAKSATPLKIFEHCGFPSTAGQATDEYHY